MQSTKIAIEQHFQLFGQKMKVKEFFVFAIVLFRYLVEEKNSVSDLHWNKINEQICSFRK